ncbi:MAG TPA: periplasmic heavy metal sensor [Thermoanaerobaculia bacterium]|nr:periplasmic heavy metal sensor [Thermoanaerobaculia bacterium]
MRRWGWIFALLISVGLNAGILATLWVIRAREPQNPPALRPREASGPLPAERFGDPPPQEPGLPDRPPPREPEAQPQGPEHEGPREGYPVRPGPQNPPGPPQEEVPFGGERELGPPGTVPTIPPPRLREFAQNLGLSGTTRERFFTLQLQMIGAMRDGRWRIQQLRREVRVEMLSDRPDRDKIEANLAAIQTAQLALERQTVRTILETREILDGEAEREYLQFITRLRLGAGEPRPNGPRPGRRMPGRQGMPGPQNREMPGGQPGFDPRQEPPGANPQDRPFDPGQNPRMNRPGGPRGGGFGRPRLFPRGERRLTPEERLERRRRFEEWQAREGAGRTPPPVQSEPEGEAAPPPI